MVEFAIIVPILVLLVFGITELGRALYQWNTLTKAVATGARYMARANDDVVNPAPDCSTDTNWDDFRVRAENLITTGQTADGGEPLMTGITVTTFESVNRPFEYSGNTKNACVIIVEAEANFETIFGGSRLPWIYEVFGDEDGITLAVRTEERYIGE